MFIYPFSFLFFLKSFMEAKTEYPSGNKRAVAAGRELLF